MAQYENFFGVEIQSKVIRQLREVIKSESVTMAITGMAMGVDQWFADVCIEERIPFIAAIAFDRYHSRWNRMDQANYGRILRECIKVVQVSDGGYVHYKMMKRNRYVVDHCDKLIAVWDGGPGGTSHTVQYAMDVKRQIVMINPRTL